MKGSPTLRIGELSTASGVSRDTLRYYEEKGLLKSPTRMDGGFRLYSAEDVERMRRIIELKSLLGFSLAEIKEMLEAGTSRARSVRSGARTQTPPRRPPTSAAPGRSPSPSSNCSTRRCRR